MFLLCLLITCSEVRRICSKLDGFWGSQFAWKSDVILTAKLCEYYKVTGQIIGCGPADMGHSIDTLGVNLTINVL